MFFDLHSTGALDGRDVILVDSNPDLIGCYETVRDQPEQVADALEDLASAHARDGAAHYYTVRDALFNPRRLEQRAADGRIAYTPELAAMLIYLNRTGFNGLFRVNAQGAFNVPAGRYERPRIADRERLRQVSTALSGPRVHLRWGSFLLVDDLAEPGDFLYFDPPYAPLSRTANFTSYTATPFDADAQRELQRLILRLVERRCHVLMSNSTAGEITALYEKDAGARKQGIRAFRVPARRAVNSNATRRGTIEEYLITNIARRASGLGVGG